MKIDVYNQQGKKLDKKADLNKAVFGIKPNDHSIYLAIKEERSSGRHGTSKSKSKSEVKGSGAKPWKQKGTGRARIGLIRNPSRVGGGTTFGPSPRFYSMKINRKVKALARRSILSHKVLSKSLVVLDKLSMDSHKTKQVFKFLKNLNLDSKKVTLLVCEKNENLLRGSKNIHNMKVSMSKAVSSYDLINNDVLIVDQQSLTHFNKI
ncbi:MAG: 50S ribosomal protein L4 [Candidatus Marinimicrobia bacterium]|nr:50S ribosomal protein L4 [Candidatus Neomarinimicrobiota bacterium]|tara:strand:- start:2668 stop:3288 length:621 start_codon:yes stop_codon:yes gene_type:complete